MVYLWQDFLRLRGRKAGTGFGPAPLEWPDFQAFATLLRKNYAPWELGTLEALDRVYLAEMTRSIDAHVSA